MSAGAGDEEAGDRVPLAFVTIGQAPRTDIVPEILGMIEARPRYDEFGALDGLARPAIGGPVPAGARSLYTRLADGSSVVAGADFVEDRLAALLRRLDRGGYDLVVLISTGVFRPVAMATPLVHGQRVLDAWIAALVMGDCRIGVIYPLDQQVRATSRHGFLIQNARLASATGEAGPLEEAAARLGDVDFILLHSVGYTEAMARQVAAAAGRPVVTARRIIAGAVRLHLDGGTDRPPPRPAASGLDLIERLPPPGQRLTERERDVLRHVLEGRSSKAIGRALGISHRTVEIHRARAMAKFGTNSTSELMRWSILGAGS